MLGNIIKTVYFVLQVTCKTTNGHDCAFPFKTSDSWYAYEKDGCTHTNPNGTQTEPWCAYEVDSNGIGKKWAPCDMSNCSKKLFITYSIEWYVGNAALFYLL